MASGVSDGALIVDTKMDNSDFMSKAKKFTNALNNLKQTAVKIGQAMGSAGNAYLKSVSEQEKAVRNLGNDYKQLQARVVELNREINRMQREGVNDGNRQAYNALNDELEQTVARMNEVRRAGDEVESVSGGFRSLVASAGQAARTLAGMVGGGAFKFLQKLAAGAKNAAVQLAKLAARAAASSIKRLGSLFSGAAKSAWGFFRNLRKGNSGGGGLQVSLKNLLRYGLGIRSLFVLFNRLRSAIKEGFAALAEQNPEVQASLSALSAALNGLKGALATAFAPILTAVTPALVALINLVTQAANAVGMLMAALTGKGFYSAAKGVASVGKAAGGAAGGVKKLNRELAGFDELTILKDNQSGGGGGGGGGGAGGQMFESVPVDSGIAEFITHIKELFGAGEYEAIGQIIGEGINKAFAKARDLISWESVSGKVESFVDAVTGIFNGLVDGIEWPDIGATFGAGIDTRVQTAYRLLTGIEWADLGQGLGDGLNGMFAEIDWPTVGATIAAALGAQLEVVGNVLATFDLGEAARNVGAAIQSFSATLQEKIEGIPWTTIGANFADGVNNLFTPENFSAAAALLASSLNGLFDLILSTVKGIKWKDIGGALGDGLNKLIEDVEWQDVADAFTAAVKGIFEFGSGFLAKFDAEEAAKNLKAALEDVDWDGIADAAWEFLTLALKKAGDFITVLFGGDVTKDAKDAVEAVEQMWDRQDRHSGTKAPEVGNGASLGNSLGEAIGQAMSTGLSALLPGLEKIVGDIPWDKIGTEIHDAIENINWIDVGTKIHYAFEAAAKGFKELALTTLFGENYLENEFVSTFLHQETADYLRDMVDQDIIPNFDVAGNALQEYIDKAVELGEPKYIDALLANLPEAFADSREAIEQALRTAQIKSEGGTVAEAEAAAAFEKTLAESGATEAIKNLNQAYENGQVQTTEYINVAKRFGLDTGNVEQSYEDMLQTVFAKAVEIIEGADGQISISDAIGRAEANLSTTPFLKPEDITFLEEALTLAAQTQGWNLGAALGDGTAEGLNDEVKAKESEIENAFVQAYGYAKRINEVNSPSELYYRLGMEDVNGFVNAFKTLPKALAGVWEKLPEWARTLLGEAHGQLGVNLTGDGDGQRMQRQTNKELKQNTKALKKLKGKKTLLGLDTSGLNELADGTQVKVGVNFVPGSDKATDSDKDGDKDKNANSGLLGWLQQIFDPGVGVDVAVSLIRNGWNSIGEFIGTFLMVLLGLGKSGWDSLGGFIGTFLTVLLGLGKSGWTSLGGFIGTFLTVLLGLGKSGWTTLGGFIGTFLTVLLGLGKSGWTTITEFFGLKPGNIFETFISLFKGNTWNPEANDAMTTGDKKVKTERSLINGTIDDTANKAMTTGDLVRKTVRNLVDGAVGFWAGAALSVGDTTTTTTRNLKDGILGFWASAALSVGDTTTTTTRNLKDGAVGFWAGAALSIGDTWTTTTRNLKDGVTDWFAKLAISAEDKTTTTTENLAKGNKWSSDAEAGVKAGNKTVTTTVNLVAGKISEFASKIAEGIKNAIGNIKQWLGVATGGTISAGGHLTRFAAGGAVSRAGALRWWNHVPKYAGGTSRAHGTMFVAGEAGPEIVGHINGKTEILNKSQLASTMYAAVQGGMLAALKGIQFRMPVMATGSVTPYAVASEAAQRDRDLQDTMNNNNEDLIQAMVSAIGNAANAIITAVQAQGGNNHIAGLTSRQVLDEFNRAAMMYAASPLKGV